MTTKNKDINEITENATHLKLVFRETDLGQAINCTPMEHYFHVEEPHMIPILVNRINYWIAHEADKLGL